TYADYLKRSSPEDDPHVDDFETIHKEAERCEVIVRRMLDFANPNVREMSLLNLPEVVREVLEFVFHERDIRTEMLVEGKIPLVQGDETQIRQALMNVMMNARQVLL